MIDRYTAGITSLLMLFIIVLLGISMAQSTNPTNAQTDTEDIIMSSNAHYGASLITDTEPVEAGQAFTLSLDIFEADGKTPVSEFDEAHTKLLHLILVSQDLSQFLHVHPDYQGEGRFTLKDIVLPASANYAVFADFTPTGDHQQVVRLDLSTQGASTSEPELTVGSLEATTGPLSITVDMPENLEAGSEQSLVFHIADAETGEPLNTLDEYLGAAGHLVIVDASSEIYLHTHPAGHDMDSMDGMSMPAHYGPDLEFMSEFPGVGLYKMWLQVQYKGEIYTAPFVVNVSEMAQVPAEATTEAHEAHG